MSKYPQMTFTLARGVGATPQGGTEQPLVPRERTFGLPALAVLAAVETPLHLPPVLGLGLLAAVAAAIHRDDGRADSQILATEAMIFLAVEGGVAQDAVPRDDQRGLFHGRGKLRSIVARSGADRGRSEEMAAGVADDGQLRPQTRGVLLAGAGEVVP